MPVLLLPLLVLGVFALWALLLPVSLWARYRSGRARRRAQGWVIRANAWLLAASVPMLMAAAWILARWDAGALVETFAGLLAGVVIGVASLWTTRFEPSADGFHYTPNRWVVLALTVLVAARIVAALVIGWRRLGESNGGTLAWIDAGGLLAVAGLLLGYGLAYTLGLRARLPQRARR